MLPLPLIISIVALFGGSLVGSIAWLLQRAIGGVDKKVDDTCTKVDKAMTAVGEMRLEMSGYKQLTEYMRTDMLEMKDENRVLRDAHAHINTYIEVQKALKVATR